MKTNGSPHPGISVHNIRVGGGAAGFLFAVGSMLVLLLGVPALRWFFVGAIVLGFGIAVALRLVHKHHSN